jgi:CCR4-NOT complex subunit CAF16
MPAIRLRGLRFSYPHATQELFRGLTLEIPEGTRTLLLGANGVGKSTLLRLIAGHHLLPSGMVEVFGRSPFDPGYSLADLSLVDGDFPITVDLRVAELLAHPSPGVEHAREKELIELLEIDPGWRMHQVSEGQRRRVQLLLALRRPVRLLLLDEVTSHLDVVARADLLSWLKTQNLRHGMTLIYTTHILDGLWEPSAGVAGAWPTDLAFLGGRLPSGFTPLSAIPELASQTLLRYCEARIRQDLGRAI